MILWINQLLFEVRRKKHIKLDYKTLKSRQILKQDMCIKQIQIFLWKLPVVILSIMTNEIRIKPTTKNRVGRSIFAAQQSGS